MNITALTPPSFLTTSPPPTAPDVAYCGDTMSHSSNTLYRDCRSALSSFFSSPDVVPWYKHDPSATQPFTLPINRTYGSCNILIQASGKAWEESDSETEEIAIEISPNDIRNMIGYAIKNCIGKGKYDGVVTKYINRTLSWLVAPSTTFPRSLNIPPSTTFLTALVQSVSHPPTTLTTDWEPGAQDTIISEIYLQAIENAVQALSLPNSEPQVQRLEERHGYIIAAQEEQRFSRFMPGPYGRWWDDIGELRREE